MTSVTHLGNAITSFTHDLNDSGPFAAKKSKTASAAVQENSVVMPDVTDVMALFGVTDVVALINY